MIDSLKRAVRTAQAIVSEAVGPGDAVVDATCGLGRDTLFLRRLVGPEGEVVALDIQDEAVEATRALLEREGCLDGVTVLKADHASIDECLPDGLSLKAVMYNLGYLPGSDRGILTTPDSTLESVRKALSALAPGGVITVCVYPHPEGLREGALLEEFARSLTGGCDAYAIKRLNREDAPYVIVFKRDEVK